MNSITKSIDAPLTMTSVELVEFINSQRGDGEAELRHDHFMAKVPKVLGDAAPKFSGTAFYVNGTGAQVERAVYRFPKREACLMAMSYSYDLQAKVFDRMTALEAEAAKPVALNPANFSRMQLIELAMQAEQERIEAETRAVALQTEVMVLTPKAEALDRIADADGLMPPMNAAKTLQVTPKRLFDHMRMNGWTYRRAGARSDVAYQDKIAAGMLTHKVHIARREDGSEKVCEQVMVTPKGLTKLARELGLQ